MGSRFRIPVSDPQSFPDSHKDPAFLQFLLRIPDPHGAFLKLHTAIIYIFDVIFHIIERVTQIHTDKKTGKKRKKGHLPSLLLLVNPSPETQS